MKRLLVVAVVAVVITGGFSGCRSGGASRDGWFSGLFGRNSGDPCCPCEPCYEGGGEFIVPSEGATTFETIPSPPATLPGPARTTPGDAG